MTTSRTSRLDQLFDEVADLPVAERSAILDRQCADDPALRQEIEELLAHDQLQQARESFMTPPAELMAHGWSSPEIGSLVAGRYRLLDVVGEGGMGVVYLAEQVSPRRTVALKVIRPGLLSNQVLRRFAQEAEVLGRLQHPGIAQIYDAANAGSDEHPLPFFVMEHVRGRPLMDYCRHASLTTSQRLQLFARICDAVHYAHEQGVVHRDLKPGNILVVDGEASTSTANSPGAPSAPRNPMPKILDFGVARSTHADVHATTLHTAPGQLVGTIPYMSPEQVAGNPTLVDARSDVYSLGVILYELLADRLPLDLADRPLPEAIRIISDVDHAPLSTIDRRFRGDLDTIVGKALEKEPARRYLSASEFAQDIRRHLEDQPIIARPPTTMYQLRKFARRNRGLVAGVAAAFVVLLLGMIGTTLGMLEATQQRNDARKAQRAAETARAAADEQRTIAQREADLARAVTAFLQDMLISADPLGGDRNIANARDVKVVDALAAASAKIDTSFQDRPDVEAGVRISLGQTYSHLGMYDEAEVHLKRALELFGRTRGLEDDHTLEVTEMLAFVHLGQHRFSEAEALHLQVLDVMRRTRAPTDPQYIAIVNALVILYTESMRYDEAERLLAETLEAWNQAGLEHTLDSMELVYNLGWLLQRQGRIEEAEPLVVEAYETRLKLQGEFAAPTLAARNNVAWMHAKFGRYQQAIDMHEHNIALAREHLPPNDWHHGIFKHNYGVALRHVGRYGDAEAVGLEALERLEQSFGVNSERPRRALQSLAELYDAWQKPQQAAAMRARLETPPPPSPGHGPTHGE